jgi:alkylated DNA repair dioxygenase AlkB
MAELLASVTEPPELINDEAKNLHLRLYRNFLAGKSPSHWWQSITEHCLWHRVKYSSARFGKSCETPCYTAFFGGFPEFAPYAPVPVWLQPLVALVSEVLGVPFNAFLLRLYFDGNDEIAWHTDGRTFLGPTPTIGSLSLGATAQFELRRMRNVWPKVDGKAEGTPYDDGIDRDTPVHSWALRDGDLLVMEGDTQAHWHHRVPKAKSRRPRININFRYIVPGTDDAERGQATYYKYMRDGDGQAIPGVPYDAILRRSGSLLVKLAPRAAGVDAAGRTCMQARHSLQITAAKSAEPADVADDGAEPDAQWACPQCTLLNPAPAPVCRLCDLKVKVHDDNGPTLKRLAAGRESEARKEHGEEVAGSARGPLPIGPSQYAPAEDRWRVCGVRAPASVRTLHSRSRSREKRICR